MTEVQCVEPVEYTDKYLPSKYGIIFKEKLYMSGDHTGLAFNVRLKKGGHDFDKL